MVSGGSLTIEKPRELSLLRFNSGSGDAIVWEREHNGVWVGGRRRMEAAVHGSGGAWWAEAWAGMPRRW
jgi:hypothetical protein